MGFARELKDFAEGFRTGVEIGSDQTRAKTEWEKSRPMKESDYDDVPDEPEGGGAKIQRVDGDSTSSTGSYEYSDINIKDDPEAAKVLGLIRNVEAGENPYNKLVGGKTGNLTDMTVGEVLQYQNTMLQKGHESTALGGYQFIRDTLKAAVRDTGTPLDAKFDQSTQDNLGYHLLQKRGWNDYKAGKLDKDTFMDNLASEWASFPLANGKSKYAGVGSNAALVGRDQVAAAIDLSGAQPATQVAEGAGAAGVKQAAAEQGIPDDNPLVESSAALKEKDNAAAAAEPIEVPETDEVALSSWDEFAQPTDFASLAEAQRIQAGGLSPQEERAARPVMWAASGGVIPEPVQSFADGGKPLGFIEIENPVNNPANPSATAGIDRYSPTRAYTQPVGGGAASTFTPRRVGMSPLPGSSSATPALTPGQPTPSQLALRTSRANRAAAEKAAADKAAADKAAADAAAAAKQQQQPAGLSRRSMAALMLGIPVKGWQQQASPQQYTDIRRLPGLYSGAGMRPSAGRFEEGGVIPEPEEVNFARGGKVESRDEMFQRFLKEESRAPGRGGGDSARDRAARRLSQSEGRASSTAYSPTNDTEYFRPAGPRKGGGGGGGKGPGGGKGGTDKIETGSTEKRFPGKEKDDRYIREQRTKDDRYIPEGRTKDDRYIPEQRTKDDLETAAPPSKKAPSRGGRPDWQPPEKKGVPKPATPTVPAYPPRGGLPVQPKPGVPYPRIPPQGPAVRTPAPVPEPPRPETAYDETGAVFDVDSGWRGIELPEPAPERFGPPQPSIVPGAWINGQFVPLNTSAAPGMGFAAGGAVPDEEDEVMHRMAPLQSRAGYTTSATGQRSSALPPPLQAEREMPATAAAARRAAPVATPSPDDQEPARAKVKATPALVSDVRKAVDGGVRFIQKHFNIGNEGAVPMPEDDATTATGARRFASGEGAATQEELEAIDGQIDPNRELDEGHRNMLRMAKTMRWYQGRGREEEAQAAAASYMQYGAARMSKLGSLAEVAYQNGDVDKAVQYLEKAYEMIPDGAEVNVRVNESTGKLEAIHTDSDGDETFMEVDPGELPGLLKSVQDKSMYWNSIFRLADPEGAKSKDIEGRDIRSGIRDEERDIRKEGREEKRGTAKEEREAKREIEKAEKEAAAKEAEHARTLAEEKDKEGRQAKEHDRQALLAAGIARAQEEFKGRDDVNMGALSETLAELSAADAADDQAGKDAALSKLWDALPDDEKRPELFEKITGGENFTSFTYTPPAANEMAKPEGLPEGAKQVKGKTSGEIYWVVPDGKGGWMRPGAPVS
jgi:muramidase (phage lysozyme)